MSHRFSNLSGRLVKAAQGVGQGLKPAKASSEIVYGPGFKVAKVSNQVVTPSSGGAGQLNKKLLANYRHFQEPSDVPVHLKGGTSDRILYITTLVLLAVGLEECGRFYYTMAFPRKDD